MNFPPLSRRSFIAGAAALPILTGTGGRQAVAADTPVGLNGQRLAWAGIKLEVGDVALFIDARAPNAEDGAPGPMLETKALRSFALVSHAHLDHYDPAALKPVLGERGLVVAHDDVARMFHDRSVNVQPVRFHEPAFLSRGGGEFVARCVAAADGLGSPQVSWIVDGNGRRIFHGGDTAWHGGWWDIGRAYGPFDAVFLPINGFQQTAGRFQGVTQPMSLTPEQAVSAAKIIGAKLAIPIHYGGGGGNYREAPDALPKFLKASAASGLATRILAPGEIFTL